MLNIIEFILLFVVPGFIAAYVYEIACGDRKYGCCGSIILALIFDLLIFIINLAGLYYYKAICTFEHLAWDLRHLKFAFKYGILSIVVGVILAVIIGLICRLYASKYKKRYVLRDRN